MDSKNHKPNQESIWVTSEELAHIWSVKPRTIHNWRKRGVISAHAILLPDQSWRYNKLEIEKLFLSYGQPLTCEGGEL